MKIAILDDHAGLVGANPHWRDLRAGIEVVSFPNHVADEAALAACLHGFGAVMRIRERTQVTAGLLDKLPNLKLILATGHRNADSLDLETARARGVVVSHTGSILSPTPELTWALILAVAKGVVAQNRSVRAGGWQVAAGVSLSGKVLGVVGLGRMGAPVARIGAAFGMTVLAWSPNMTAERGRESGATAVGKRELFARSDVVSIHMPKAASTIGLVGAADIAAMKKDAILVNTSRGELIDDAALIAALVKGRIAGAGLDVFDREPLPRVHPYRYLPNVVATPHLGYVTGDTFDVFVRETVENIHAYLDGTPIRTL